MVLFFVFNVLGFNYNIYYIFLAESCLIFYMLLMWYKSKLIAKEIISKLEEIKRDLLVIKLREDWRNTEIKNVYEKDRIFDK